MYKIQQEPMQENLEKLSNIHQILITKKQRQKSKKESKKTYYIRKYSRPTPCSQTNQFHKLYSFQSDALRGDTNCTSFH